MFFFSVQPVLSSCCQLESSDPHQDITSGIPLSRLNIVVVTNGGETSKESFLYLPLYACLYGCGTCSLKITFLSIY